MSVLIWLNPEEGETKENRSRSHDYLCRMTDDIDSEGADCRWCCSGSNFFTGFNEWCGKLKSLSHSPCPQISSCVFVPSRENHLSGPSLHSYGPSNPIRCSPGETRLIDCINPGGPRQIESWRFLRVVEGAIMGQSIWSHQGRCNASHPASGQQVPCLFIPSDFEVSI